MSTFWNDVYQQKSGDERSWTQRTASLSLELLSAANISSEDHLLDVGGGSSLLVATLASRGYRNLHLLDISDVAVSEAVAQLEHPTSVTTYCADVTQWQPPHLFDAWHDRAVFHFLVDDEHRQLYRETLAAATTTGAVIIVATFAPTGPERCSGLPVRRYDADELAEFFAPLADLEETRAERHETPWATTQDFTWVRLRRR